MGKGYYRKGRSGALRFERRKKHLWGTLNGMEATVPLEPTVELATKEGRKAMADLERALRAKVDDYTAEREKRRRVREIKQEGA